MMAWQRGARLMTVAVGVTVSVAVFVTIRRREPPPVPQSVPRLDPAAVVESPLAKPNPCSSPKRKATTQG